MSQCGATYSGFDECNRFMHDYVRRTSRYIAGKYGDNNKLERVPINYQIVDTDYYLKIVISARAEPR